MKAGTGWTRTTEIRYNRLQIGSGLRLQSNRVVSAAQAASPGGSRPFHSLPYVEERNFLHIFWRLCIIFIGAVGSRNQTCEVTGCQRGHLANLQRETPGLSKAQNMDFTDVEMA